MDGKHTTVGVAGACFLWLLFAEEGAGAASEDAGALAGEDEAAGALAGSSAGIGAGAGFGLTEVLAWVLGGRRTMALGNRGLVESARGG